LGVIGNRRIDSIAMPQQTLARISNIITTQHEMKIPEFTEKS
jgi:hypothetical protein